MIGSEQIRAMPWFATTVMCIDSARTNSEDNEHEDVDADTLRVCDGRV